MKTIEISTEEIEQAKNFAERTWNNHQGHGREKSTIIYNIFIGKLGEIGFKKMFPNASEINFNGNHCDPGYDFILNNKRIDIKTLDQKWKCKVYFNKNYLNADFYAVMQYNKLSSTIIFLGCISCKDLLNKAVFEENTSYVSIDYLKKEELWN